MESSYRGPLPMCVARESVCSYGFRQVYAEEQAPAPRVDVGVASCGGGRTSAVAADRCIGQSSPTPSRCTSQKRPAVLPRLRPLKWNSRLMAGRCLQEDAVYFLPKESGIAPDVEQQAATPLMGRSHPLPNEQFWGNESHPSHPTVGECLPSTEANGPLGRSYKLQHSSAMRYYTTRFGFDVGC
jgi:hypothetical protein